MTASTRHVAPSSARTGRDAAKPAPPVATQSEARATPIVDPPLTEPPWRGAVRLRDRAGNRRVVRVFGPAALAVSPRIGHIHVTVEKAPRHCVAARRPTMIVAGLPPGPHKAPVALADPGDHIVNRQTVDFVVP